MMKLTNRNIWRFSLNWALKAVFCSLVLWGLFVAAVLAQGSAKDMDEATRRQKVNELYQKQIPLLEQYIQKYPDGPRAAESMFRLGEAYFESAKYAQIQGQESRVSFFNDKAVEVLEKLRASHSSYPRMAEALYVLASTYLEKGQSDAAGPVLADLANQYPNSEILKNASYLIGDYYFEKAQYSQAKTFYEKARAHKQSSAYGNYKLAWIALHESQPALALKYFEQVLQINRSGQEAFDYSRDAAREMVWPAIEVYGSQKVVEYLEKVLQSTELIKSGLSSLAEGLMKKGEYRIASQVFDRLTQKFSTAPEMQDWIAKQLECEEKLGRSDRIASLVSKLSGSSQDSSQVQSKIYASAKKYHALAQAEKSAQMKSTLYDQAIAYYQAYLQLSGAPKQAETKFYMGEALYARARYNEAMAMYKSSLSEKHDKQNDAAWNWYLTAEKLAPGFKYDGKELRATTSQDEEFLSAARAVAQLESLPIDQRRKASYQSARLLYQLNDYDRALPIFQQMAELYPNTQEGKLSADLVLDIYNLRNDYQKVAQYARAYQQTASGGQKSDLSTIEEKAVLKSIQEEEKLLGSKPEAEKLQGQKQVAAKYLNFVRQYPNSTLADATLWTAIQLQATVASKEGDKEFSDLRVSFNLLTQKYAQSKFSSEAVKLMGNFLADQNASPEVYKAYAAYRDTWEKQMLAMPAMSRGSLGLIVYELSSENQKRQLEKTFAKLPNSQENRQALALGRLAEVKLLAKKYNDIQLNQLASLAANTKNKIQALENLEVDVTKLVELGVPKIAIEALYLLSESYASMGDALRKAPEPKNLEDENIEKYRAAVSEKASGFERKAQEIRAAADKTSRELGV